VEKIFPKIAILLAAYNGSTYIAQQLESILQQNGVDIQIFVSVDQSTDGTESFVATCASTESRLTVLPFGQRFGGAGPNFFRLL